MSRYTYIPKKKVYYDHNGDSYNFYCGESLEFPYILRALIEEQINPDDLQKQYDRLVMNIAFDHLDFYKNKVKIFEDNHYKIIQVPYCLFLLLMSKGLSKIKELNALEICGSSQYQKFYCANEVEIKLFKELIGVDIGTNSDYIRLELFGEPQCK